MRRVIAFFTTVSSLGAKYMRNVQILIEQVVKMGRNVFIY
nr:MAG TPA: hypothetical protein [Caudoviricetes sp.]